ncbi:hypothetical protein [Acinetobacter nosocomialis]|uniref:hypothetical protein n=1 Tax=Acinetobacter nosocomialis TaxID=106654 RepID=UPI0026ED7AE1|nr:hypothetical protein [Acinetobacter nosocomialis]MDO7219833.1 hypothetical protein [Acinetobacter nosocomialis]
MADKELKDKIKIVGFWTFGGVFWYLVISFFLLSDYPMQNFSFDNKKAYEVLKDALTIAAAFLAPVAAFVLFDDWRTSHRLKNNESEVLSILKKIRNIPYKVKDLAEDINILYEMGMTSESVVLYENKAIELASEILSESGNINFSQKNFSDTKFHEKCLDFYSENYKLITYIMMLFDAFKTLEQFKKDPQLHSNLKKCIDHESNTSLIYYDFVSNYLTSFEDKLEEIHKYAEKHRIR